MDIQAYIKTDDELFEMDVQSLINRGLYTEENVAQAYLKNLIVYLY